MKIKKAGYGTEPILLGNFDLEVGEMMFYMYLPIKMAGDVDLHIPKRLEVFKPIIWASIDAVGDDDFVEACYLYITAKHVHVTADNKGNRPGWHSDGFMTDDYNFVWTDRCPTEFAIQPICLIQDDLMSMDQMQSEIQADNVTTYPTNNLLMLDQYNIHRVSESDDYSGMRTFVKISLSKNRYNLKGNSHNYLMDYTWNMHDRNEHRNATDIATINEIRKAG